MPRLIDILRQHKHPLSTELRNDMPVVVVDNVARYYWEHSRDEWKNDRDFPCVKAPFNQTFWMEYKMPKTGYAEGIGKLDLTSEFANTYMGTMIGVKKKNAIDIVLIWCRVIGGKPNLIAIHLFLYETDDKGTIVQYYTLYQDTAEKISMLSTFAQPFLLALSFMNCRNLEVVTVDHTPEIQKARRKKNRPPLISYKVINILGLGEKQRSRSVTTNSPEEPIGVALHIRRGHFAKYGEENGKLFGKYEGLFWKPQAVVGNANNGIALHDYAVGV